MDFYVLALSIFEGGAFPLAPDVAEVVAEQIGQLAHILFLRLHRHFDALLQKLSGGSNRFLPRDALKTMSYSRLLNEFRTLRKEGNAYERAA